MVRILLLLDKVGRLALGGQFACPALDTEAQRDEGTWAGLHKDKLFSASGVLTGLASKPGLFSPHPEMMKGDTCVLAFCARCCDHSHIGVSWPTSSPSCSIHDTRVVKTSTDSLLLRGKSSHPGPGASTVPASLASLVLHSS